MNRIAAVATTTALLIVGLAFGGRPVTLAAAAGDGIHLSTTTLTPGSTVVISGTGWNPGTSVDAVLCGADAVDGSADCASTTTDTMVATQKGLFWTEMTPVVPPKPCPCVILFTGATTTFTQRVPVTVAGATSAPVPTAAPVAGVSVSEVHVTGSTTLESSLGASALRRLSLRITDVGSTTVTPVLVGRWGTGTDPRNVVRMPSVGALGPGQSRVVTVPFRLGAFSVGTYDVRVDVQLLQSPHVVTVTSSTTQWPIGLFVLACLVMLSLVSTVILLRRRRHARLLDTGSPPGATPTEPPSENGQAAHAEPVPPPRGAPDLAPSTPPYGNPAVSAGAETGPSTWRTIS